MKQVLDLGCGNKKIRRSDARVVGVDHAEGDADVIHDLNVFPYPFKDGEFDEVVCYDLLEHLADVPKVMHEIWRISKKGAKVIIRSPHFSSVYAHLDPTHLRSFSALSFDCFASNKKIIPHHLDEPLFFIEKRVILFPKLHRTIFFPFAWLANRYPLRYEQYFAYMFQAENAYFEMSVLK